jgi:hypothetical protein
MTNCEIQRNLAKKRSPKDSSVTVAAYVVEVPHVKVTVKVGRECGAYLSRQTPWIQSRYGSCVASHWIRGDINTKGWFDHDTYWCTPDSVARFESQPRSGFEVTVTMSRYDWDIGVKTAKRLGCSIAALMRESLARRVCTLQEFHASQRGASK